MEQPQEEKKNWWGRNWKWFVPVGCLSLIVLFVGFAALIIALVFGVIKSSDVYEEALAQAQGHPSVQQSLGTPVDDGYFVSGSINVSGSGGDANFSIPLSGPNADGTLHVDAEKFAGEWSFNRLVLEVDDSGEYIDLLE